MERPCSRDRMGVRLNLAPSKVAFRNTTPAITLLTHADECDLAFRWQHCRDRRCLHALVLAFNPLVFGLAAEHFARPS